MQNSKHKSHHLAHLVHLENTCLQNSKPNYQLVSLTSHLFKLKWQNTSTMCQSIKEASGELCCVVDELLWPDQDRRWDTDWFTCRSFSPYLRKASASVQLKISLCYSNNEYLVCYFFCICALISSLHRPKDNITSPKRQHYIAQKITKTFSYLVIFILLTYQCNTQCSTVCFAKIGNIGVFSELQRCCSINYKCTVWLWEAGIVSLAGLAHWIEYL